METLALFVSVFFTLACNRPFFTALTAQRTWAAFDTWYLLVFTGLLITGIHWLFLLLLINRWTAKPLLILLLCTTAPAVYFMGQYAVYLDKSMMRNFVETDLREVGDLLDRKMLLYLIGYAVVPASLIWRMPIAETSFRHAVFSRLACLLLAALTIGASGWTIIDQLIPTMRDHKELRYLVTPANYLTSMVRVLVSEKKALAGQVTRAIIAPDAHRSKLAGSAKPKAFVLVVGETVRAENWGLNGYPRQTTPELAKRDVVNFRNVTSCGTDTATSVPCMFSPFGRRNYRESSIRSSESVLHLLNRTGVAVRWRDNQSGCKGVCDGLPFEKLARLNIPEICGPEGCFDEILLRGLKEQIETSGGDILIILHMLGSHGPSYYERYPSAFRRFTPTCDTSDLATCSRDALTNTYDNTILYADYVLGRLIDQLSSIRSHETGMIYVSDHGESLGENHLYLHGMPYYIAPRAQIQVPMVMWLSPSLRTTLRLGRDCINRSGNTEAVSHDYLFHTLLRLFDVKTASYNPSMDLITNCEQRPLAN